MYPIILLCLTCLLPSFSSAEGIEEKKTVCLNMIVKNESKVIERCLSSVKPFIDYWVIVDTGSNDATQTIIQEYLKDIPGELHEKPWKNFAHNRNEALNFAKGKSDYILFIDADETLEFASDFKMKSLDKDSYNCIIKDNGCEYERVLLVKADRDWRWQGVLHEYLGAPNARTSETITGIQKISRREGARSADPKKYEKDAEVLEAALKEEPNNARYVFYLAQSYRDAGNYPEALKNYERRINMGGWDQEVFYSMLQAALLQEKLRAPQEIINKSYYEAYHYRPSRAEPLYYLAKYYRSKNNFASAYLLSSIGMTIPYPKDILFVDKWIYDYDMQFENSINAYWIGKYEECQRISLQLLNNPNLPINIKEIVKKNLDFANQKMIEKTR